MLNTPKGFRDFVGKTAQMRSFVVGQLVKVFEKYGFEPLETPALEFTDTLKGKYGEEEKLIYSFTTPGGDKVSLRYDQTVPLARVLAQYQDIPKPYKRYQIQSVWRGENTQKGRYREFLQCDVDTAGTTSLLADAEIIALALEAAKNLGFKKPVMKVNDRQVFEGIESKFVSAIDKLEKIGEDKVIEEMVAKGLSENEAKDTLNKVRGASQTDNLNKLFNYLKEMGVEETSIQFDPTLARGLNYYTGPIFELKDENYPYGSLGGGGRYDRLLSTLGSTDLPATGFSFGFDRLIEAMGELNLFKERESSTKRVLVTIFNEELAPVSLEVVQKLRLAGIKAEIYLNESTKLEKQLKYSDQKGFDFAIIIGPDEKKLNSVNLKNLAEKTQETLTLEQVIEMLLA